MEHGKEEEELERGQSRSEAEKNEETLEDENDTSHNLTRPDDEAYANQLPHDLSQPILHGVNSENDQSRLYDNLGSNSNVQNDASLDNPNSVNLTNSNVNSDEPGKIKQIKDRTDDIPTSKLSLDSSDIQNKPEENVMLNCNKSDCDKLSSNNDKEENPDNSKKQNNEEEKEKKRSGKSKETGIDLGTEGGDEGEGNDEGSVDKKRKQKRRLTEGAAAAPAPKIKRMRKPQASSANKDDKSSKKSQENEEYYQEQIQKKKEREREKLLNKDDDEEKDDKKESEKIKSPESSKSGKHKKSSSSENDSSDEESSRKKMKQRSGGLSAMPKVKNLRKNIRDIMSDDRLEDDTLAAQKEEKLRLQRLQEKRVALREYMEQQEVRKNIEIRVLK